MLELHDQQLLQPEKFTKLNGYLNFITFNILQTARAESHCTYLFMRQTWRSLHQRRLHETSGATEIYIITSRIPKRQIIAF